MGQRIENSSSPDKLKYDENDSSDSDRDESTENHDDVSSDGFKSLSVTFNNLRSSVPQPSPLFLLQLHNSQKWVHIISKHSFFSRRKLFHFEYFTYGYSVTCSSVCYSSKLLAVGDLNSNVKVFSFSEERVTLPTSRSLSVRINVPSYSEDSIPNANSG